MTSPVYYYPQYQYQQPTAPPEEQVNKTFYPNPSTYQGGMQTVAIYETEWVLKAELPKDSISNKIYYGFLDFFKPNYTQADLVATDFNSKERAILFQQAGDLFYASYIHDPDQYKQAERKTDEVFQQFLNSLTPQEQNAFHCYTTALHHNPNQAEALFGLGKLHFAEHKYENAAYYFQQAKIQAPYIQHASSDRIDRFVALADSARAACYERLGWPGDALLTYMDAAKVDPQGNAPYEKALSRNFLVLKNIPNKTLAELSACAHFAPKNPEFPIEAGYVCLREKNIDGTLGYLHQAIDLAAEYQPNALYECAQLIHNISAYLLNPPPPPYSEY